jgi:hypothetical protein
LVSIQHRFLGTQGVAQRPKRGSDARAEIHQHVMQRVTQERADCVGNIDQTHCGSLCICACPVMGKGCSPSAEYGRNIVDDGHHLRSLMDLTFTLWSAATESRINFLHPFLVSCHSLMAVVPICFTDTMPWGM